MKALIKYIFCSILYYLGPLDLIIKFHINSKKKLPVILLIYHRITENINNEINDELTINHPLNNFIKEMKFIKKWLNIVSLDKAIEIIKSVESLDKPTIAITFDDGFEDNYRLAYPVLKEFCLPATIFLTAGFISTQELPWIEKIGQAILQTKERRLSLNSCFNNEEFNLGDLQAKRCAFNRITAKLKETDYSERMHLLDEIITKLGMDKESSLRMLNWQEIQEMSQNNIAFGAHTISHPILSKMPMELAKKEISESKFAIEDKLGISIKHFAFPNGRKEDFSEELKQYCKDIGFESVSTAIYGNNKLGQDIYALKRLSPGKNMPIFAFDLMRGFLRNE